MESFYEIINGDTLVLVDFFATWCGPCKAMTPVLESLAGDLKGKVRILKVDIDRNQNIAIRYNIQAVPTLILFKKGEIMWRQSGGMDKSTLLGKLNMFTE